MDIIQLKTFVSVAHYLNFTRAAEDNHITQSAVTKRMKKLEEELGVSLFEIAGKQVIPTSAAKQLLPKAEEILRLHKNTLETIQNPEGVTLTLSIGLSLYVVQEYFDVIIAATNVPLQLNWFSVERDEIVPFIKAGKIDLMIATSDVPLSDELHKEVLCREKLVCTTNKRNTLTIPENISLNELSQYSAVLTRTDYSIRNSVNAAFSAAELGLKLFAELNSLSAIKQVVKSHDAWSILPERYLDNDLHGFSCSDLPTTLEICAYTHIDRVKSNLLLSVLAQLTMIGN